MRRVGILMVSAMFLVASLVVATTHQVPADEATEERLSDLEDRVTELEATVARLEGQGGGNRTDSDAEVETHTITLTLVLIDSDGITGSTANCRGMDGYDDIRRGASVVVMDGEGTIIASSQLGPGEKTLSPRRCTFEAVIEDVPEVAFYQFEVGHRGAPRYSLEDMEGANWRVDLEIGR